MKDPELEIIFSPSAYGRHSSLERILDVLNREAPAKISPSFSRLRRSDASGAFLTLEDFDAGIILPDLLHEVGRADGVAFDVDIQSGALDTSLTVSVAEEPLEGGIHLQISIAATLTRPTLSDKQIRLEVARLATILGDSLDADIIFAGLWLTFFKPLRPVDIRSLDALRSRFGSYTIPCMIACSTSSMRAEFVSPIGLDPSEPVRVGKYLCSWFVD